MVKPQLIRQLLLLANALVLAVVLNQLSSRWFFRVDLTEEQRYSIKPQTISLLEGLEDDVFIEVFLEGDLNPGFRRFQRAVRDVLEEFRVNSGGRVAYVFSDPGAAQGEKARNEFLGSLINRGLEPLNIIENRDGQRKEQVLVPGAILSFGGTEVAVNLVRNKSFQGDQATDALNQSIETIEYELAAALSRLAGARNFRIGWATGHGETTGPESAGIRQAIRERYALQTIDIPSVNEITETDVLVVTRPLQPWSQQDVFKLDQFVMSGGRVMFLLETNAADRQQMLEEDYYVPPVNHGLDDLLFRYGIRCNTNVVQDAVALPIPVVTGAQGQITPIDWPFYPLAASYADHPATRNLDPSVFRFAASLDTVSAKGIRKIPLVLSSPYARVVAHPVKVQANDLRNQLKPENFNKGPFILAAMLEGPFQSAFRNRFRPDHTGTLPFREAGVNTRLVVVGDADIAFNEVNTRTGNPWPAGYDPVTRQTFANQDLLLNMISWLADEQGIISARTRKVTLRMLDKTRIREERLYWQFFNLGIPIILMSLLVLGLHAWRKRKYTRFGK